MAHFFIWHWEKSKDGSKDVINLRRDKLKTDKPKITKMTRKPAPIIEANTASPEEIVTTAMDLGNLGWSTIKTEDMKEILMEIDPTLTMKSIDQIVGSLDKGWNLTHLREYDITKSRSYSL